ncbi:MAG: hypothetical protein D6758_04605 [Gammaproteobacteria bacterium]|nr:MAG: hypothetical protein D6758_04605 [Gammaproteobacteria bacterium]
MRVWGILGIVFTAVIAACAVVKPPATIQAGEWTLVYAGNLNGELEACGCTVEGNLGGILRQTQILDAWRAEKPDTFFVNAGGLFNSRSPTDKITSAFIRSGAAQQGWDAIGLQWKDLDYGVEPLVESGLPWVASNAVNLPFEKVRLIEKAGRKLAFYSWLNPSESPYAAMQGDGFPRAEASAAFSAQLKNSREQGYLNVVSTTLTAEEADRLLPMDLIDVLIVRAVDEEYREPVMKGQTLILQPGTRGQRLARLTLNVSDKGEVSVKAHQVFTLPAKVGEAERLKDWYQGYTDALMEDYQRQVALLTGEGASAKSPYAGTEACAGCHVAASEAWKNSNHAHAFEQLEKVNKQFDANCIGCHTVGFGEPGGFIDPQSTPERMNVQCESCHGPAKAHVESGGQVKLAEVLGEQGPVCLQCHTPEHSPSFDFETYWPRIVHGLDARPASP